MRLHYGVSHQLRRLSHRYPILRRFSLTTTFLTLLWFYVLYRGERKTFRDHIDACSWDKWERWPKEAAPHRLVLIADPQLVDPHTYPGRPWPLSSLTETYTDAYMARNFRLINAELDPDSIVLLGDLFDGGREWAPPKALDLNWVQRAILIDLGVIPEEPAKRPSKNQKRSWESYNFALEKAKDRKPTMMDHALDPDGKELKGEFTYQEESLRWKDIDDRQWKADLTRFSKIFWEPRQIYPKSQRSLFPAFARTVDPTSLANGADNVTWSEFASTGDKRRQIIMDLPGNHDLGFGRAVQWSVRDRYQAHFGDGNRLYILGNHTFVNLDVLSFSARGQFLREGGETLPKHLPYQEHLWKPANDFLLGLHSSAGRMVERHLEDYYPKEHTAGGFAHEVVKINGAYNPSSSPADSANDTDPIQFPVVLMTHVPLYRLPDEPCGPLRERTSSIPVAFGYQYQNVLSPALSREIVTKVRGAGEIVRVFSGDDHNYCDVTHKYNIGPWDVEPGSEGSRTMLTHIREITVKTFSWAMGVRRPGFVLVSLWNPIDANGKTIGTPLPTIQTQLCLLPDQLRLFINYLSLLAFTLIILVPRAVYLALQPQEEPTPDAPSQKWSFPKRRSDSNGRTDGHGLSARSLSADGRERASSTSLSTDRGQGTGLGMQRGLGARTRSVSPAVAEPDFRPGSLVEKAGYFPKVSWQDPEETDEDEESRVGAWDREHDSQGKWKLPKQGFLWRLHVRLTWSFLCIWAPCAVWYMWLSRH